MVQIKDLLANWEAANVPTAEELINAFSEIELKCYFSLEPQSYQQHQGGAMPQKKLIEKTTPQWVASTPNKNAVY